MLHNNKNRRLNRHLNHRRHQWKMASMKSACGLTFAAIATLTILSGCSLNAPLALLDKVQSGATHVKSSAYRAAASSIDRYCLRVPETKRQQVRNNINSRTSVGDIAITCANEQ